MIIINDYDDPITIAQKLIHGTQEPKSEEEQTASEKLANAISKSFGLERGTPDILTKEEIKELADYLNTWYEAHKDNELA